MFARTSTLRRLAKGENGLIRVALYNLGMDDLVAVDAAIVLKAANELIELRQDEDFAASVLGVVHSVIPCDIVSYNEVNLATGKTHAAVFPPTWIPLVDELMPVFEQAVRDNPIARYVAETGCTTATRLEDLVDDDELFQTSFYNDFLSGLLGLRHQLAIGVPSPSWLVFGVALSRGPGDRFTDRDVSLLNALGPHLVHCYQRAAAVRSQGALKQAVAEDGWAVVSTDKHGTVLRIDGDPGAAFMIGRRAPSNILQLLEGPHEDAPLPAAPLKTTSEVGGALVQVHRSVGSGYLMLVRHGGTNLKTSLVDRGFTGRQADVAEHLLLGGTNTQIAGRLGISTGTVRKHLEALYRGLGVQDRASAISHIAGYTSKTGAI